MYDDYKISEDDAQNIRDITDQRVCEEREVSDCGCIVFKDESELTAKVDKLAQNIEGLSVTDLEKRAAKSDEFGDDLTSQAYQVLVDIAHEVLN